MFSLALSARRPPTLAPSLIYNGLPAFLRSIWLQPTDSRLASLLRVVQAAHIMGGRAESIENLEAFTEDVDAVERYFLYRLIVRELICYHRDYLSTIGELSRPYPPDSTLRQSTASIDPKFDKMGQHFPFSPSAFLVPINALLSPTLVASAHQLLASLRWYRLAFASTLLPPAGPSWRYCTEPLRMSVEWASQILFHLSSSAAMTSLQLAPVTLTIPLEPDEDLVGLLSFAIDQYFIVMSVPISSPFPPSALTTRSDFLLSASCLSLPVLNLLLELITQRLYGCFPRPCLAERGDRQ